MRQDSRRPRTVKLLDSTSAQTRTLSLEDMEGEYNFTMQNILETPTRNTSSIAPDSFATAGTKRICRHAWGTLCWWSWWWFVTDTIYRNCVGKRWSVQSNQADEGAKISWWMWPRRRSFKICAGLFHWHFGGSIQWFDEDWTGTNWLVENIVQNAA